MVNTEWYDCLVSRCTRAASGAVLDDEFGACSHAEKNIVVVVAARHAGDALPDGVGLCEVKGRPGHRRNLARGDGCAVQRCIVVPAWKHSTMCKSLTHCCSQTTT